jgi:hypothetical protein
MSANDCPSGDHPLCLEHRKSFHDQSTMKCETGVELVDTPHCPLKRLSHPEHAIFSLTKMESTLNPCYHGDRNTKTSVTMVSYTSHGH